MRSRLLFAAAILIRIGATAVAHDPWIDHTIATDPAAEKEILRELRNNAVLLFKSVAAKQEVSVASRSEEAAARFAMFVAAARYAWADNNFAAAHRATEYAAFTAHDLADHSLRLYEGGLTTIEEVVAAQQQRAQAQLVLLRFRTEAANRGIDLPPASREMMKTLIQQSLKEPTLP